MEAVYHYMLRWLYIVTNALKSPALYLVQDPAHRLGREEVVPKVRYRVAQEGWGRVAESAVKYEVPPQCEANGGTGGNNLANPTSLEGGKE